MTDDININDPIEPENLTNHETEVWRPSDPRHLRGMYRNWFLDYASYVILERAVPHLDDGLKPVQRRILHSMKSLDDGRYNKVANIVGHTMQYHPHGDASINDALVQLGQKELLVDTQGNWGNTLTGAGAAAGRYIEARLSPFALETLYNAKITEWVPSYDGRSQEPVTLPVKFPLLLFQGVEGIAVGLSSKILPHNFNEIIDAAVDYLEGRDFQLVPDFPTGGFIDVSRYNDGQRGGAVKIRAKVEKIDNKTLAITEIPYGKTTETIKESIVKASEKGKIKVRTVEDLTAQSANILVHLLPGTSSDKAIDGLYAFTDCEVSISPNCCVISEKKPHFLSVSAVLRHSADRTRNLFKREMEIKRAEVEQLLHYASLERIFIENRIYKDKEFENAADVESVLSHVRGRIELLVPTPTRPITDDDLKRLLEIRMKRILKFNSKDADRLIQEYQDQIARYTHNIEHITEYTVEWFRTLKEKYGAAYPRRTVVRGFDNIEAAQVVEANERLYLNRVEGFIGTALKKDENTEFISQCSMMDDVIVFYKDGRYKVVKVAEKLSIDKNVLHVAVFKKNDKRTIYNVIYQDGKGGTYYMKRFAVTGITRDREYNITQEKPGSKVVWFSANSNGEAEVVNVTLKPKPRLKTLQLEVDFSTMQIKGRNALGNIVTRNEVYKFSLKKKGGSTLGGREVWFDPDVLRINYDGRGDYLGEFGADDLVLVITRDGEYYTTGFDATNHYDDNILRIEKFRPGTIWTAVLDDAEQGYPYIKRFPLEPSAKKVSFIGENPDSKLVLLTDQHHPVVQLIFGGADSYREPLDIEAEEFIGVKSFKAKGKRLTTFNLDHIELISTEEPEPETKEEVIEEVIDEISDEAHDEISDDELRDEINGQQRIF